MKLVLDASAAVHAALAPRAAESLRAHELIAPPLMWSEATSGLRQGVWRGELTEEKARLALSDLDALDVGRRSPRHLHRLAFEIATELGWAKTYDAEFLALARIEGATVLSVDARLVRGAAHTGLVTSPGELPVDG